MHDDPDKDEEAAPLPHGGDGMCQVQVPPCQHHSRADPGDDEKDALYRRADRLPVCRKEREHEPRGLHEDRGKSDSVPSPKPSQVGLTR